VGLHARDGHLPSPEGRSKLNVVIIKEIQNSWDDGAQFALLWNDHFHLAKAFSL
jgi:hypothetical protein